MEEQSKVQASKDRCRTLEEYNTHYLFNTLHLDENGLHGDFGRAVTKTFKLPTFTRKVAGLFDSKTKVTHHYARAPKGAIAAIIEHLHTKFKSPLKWSDVGAGFNFAQKDFQWNHRVANRKWKVECERVDLFDWDSTTLIPSITTEVPAKRRKAWLRRASQPANKLIQGDATVVPFGGSHLITAIEVLQYIDDKLAAICHWYNQLADGGLLIIGLETSWSHLMGNGNRDYAIMEELLNSVSCIADSSSCCSHDRASSVSTLIIRKKPNHALKALAVPCEIYTNSYGYKTSIYPAQKSYIGTV